MPRSAAKAFLKFAHAQIENDRKMSDNGSTAPSAAYVYYYDDDVDLLCDDAKKVVAEVGQNRDFFASMLLVKLSAAESALLFVFCLLIITGNLTVMIWRCKRRREERNSIPSLLVVNLAAADLLLGIQLVIFFYLYNWSCSALGSPNDVKIMTSLCYISGVMESTSILTPFWHDYWYYCFLLRKRGVWSKSLLLRNTNMRNCFSFYWMDCCSWDWSRSNNISRLQH